MNKRFNKNPMARGIDVAYLSPSASRRLSIDMPIGDPRGGAAYGEKNMPVVVVALAAGSFAAGAAAIATATTLFATVAAGALMVGSALTIVGTVTGNQKLTKIGGYISLAGGVASLANGLAGAGAAGAGAENVAPVLSDTAADVTGTALTDAAGSVAADSVTGLAGDAANSTLSSGLMDAASATTAAPGASLTSGVTDAATAAAEAGAQTAGTEAVTQAASTPFVTTDASPFAPSGASNAFTAPSSNSNGLLGGIEQFDHTSSFVPTEQGGIQGYFDKAGSWIKNNKELAQIGANAVGGLAKGLVPSAQEKAQTDLLRQQAERERIRQLWRQGRIA